MIWLLLFSTFVATLRSISADGVDAWPQIHHGWKVYGDDGSCEVEKVSALNLTAEEFHTKFAFSKPVVITDLGVARNQEFRQVCSRDEILEKWGDSVVLLSTANTKSYDKRRSTLKEYITEIVDDESVDFSARGSDTWYWFGDNDHAEWSTFFDKYVYPPFADVDKVAISFGIGQRFSGVPFHIHGRVFAETIVGRKKWLLLPPGKGPNFDGEESTASWLSNAGTDLTMGRREETLLDCTVHESEVLYIPADWWHATLNLDQTVFISSFIDDSFDDDEKTDL